MTSFRPDALVFDFDLTLVNSVDGFVECHAVAARAFGFDPPSRDSVGRTIGTPLPDVFRLLYGPENEALLDPWLRAYQVRADEVMTGLTEFLDGAPEAIERLHSAGIPLGIVSQKLRYRVEDVLNRAGLAKCFAVIIGGDDVPALKPDPRGLLTALERLAATAGRSFFVGDTTIDADTAYRAEVPFIAVLTGYATPGDFEAFNPFALLESVADLPNLLGVAESTPDANLLDG